MSLLEPRYSRADQERLEALRSRINVARALLAARVANGLTQEELGKAAGTKQSRVSEIEAMKGNPRFDTLDRIARAANLMVALLPRTSHSILPEGYHAVYTVTTSCERGVFSTAWDSKWSPASRPLTGTPNG